MTAQENTNEAGVVDITDVAGSLQKTFITWGADYAFTALVATPGFAWAGFPIIDVFVKAIIKNALGLVATSTVMESFFINTSIRKSSQAEDYLTAVTAKSNLPPTATTEEYENAEKAEIDAFNSFVVLGN